MAVAAIVAAVLVPRDAARAWPSEWLKCYGGDVPVEDFVRAWGVTADRAGDLYGKNDVVSVLLVDSNVPANILWPKDNARFTFQFVNLTDAPAQLTGRGLIIQYGVHTNDWVGSIGVHKVADAGSIPVSIDIEAGSYQDVTLDVPIPAKLGGYAFIFDFPGQDRLFGATCVRTYKADIERRQFHKFTMDAGPVEVLKRLGAAPNRMGIGYFPTTSPDFENEYAKVSKHLDELNAANLPVTLEFGCGKTWAEEQPLGRPRPHLTEDGTMLDTKSDIAWFPSFDEDFRQVVKKYCIEHGWPNGPVNGVMLWNEPWEGMSISGWGADMPRYREIYTAMALGVEDARREAGVDVLIGGCDSSSNTFDKLFSDGTDDMMKWLDFMSIHYQGMSPASMVKKFRNRTQGKGRVLIWDTESWVANSEDRISSVIPSNYATGHDRCVGVQSDNVAYSERWIDVKTPNGNDRRLIIQAWPVAAGIGASQHMIGHRAFKEVLFKNGLPWVYLFDGMPGADGEANPDDGTVVVIGDLGPVFGFDNLLFRTVRGLAEVKHEEELREKLDALPKDAAEERAAIQKEIDAFEQLSGATMSVAAEGSRFDLFDFYGNKVPAIDGQIVIPLDARGYYLRSDGTDGSFAALVKAVRSARIDGFEPLQTVCRDMLQPIDERPDVRLELTNVLNRPVAGALHVTLGSLQLEYPAELSFRPHETKAVNMVVAGGSESPDNAYPLSLEFDAGADGRAVHRESLHVNLIHKRTIVVDGVLDEWKGCLPQTIVDAGDASVTLMEQAWQPYLNFDKSVQKGVSTAYLAYDEERFYFAAKIADATPDGGTMRIETRDDDQFYYPEVCFVEEVGGGHDGTDFSVRWVGYVKPEHTDRYRISTLSDDGIRVWVNGKQLVDNWTGHGDTWNFGVIELQAGTLNPIKVEFYQGGGGATLQLCWESVKQKKQVIPPEALFRDDAGTKPGLDATYCRGRDLKNVAQERVDAKIDYQNWPGKVDDADFGLERAPVKRPLRWPEGVRRYSYRKGPVLPAGNAPNFDNVQIAFNVLDEDMKPWHSHPPGTMPRFTSYSCTDYEYALNKVHEQYGGGTEMWRLQYPEMPHKHFYPRQPKSPFDGPVEDGALVVVQGETTRIVEASIPWSELGSVKARMDAGETVKFSYRVNDNAGVGCMELSRLRSVAKRNGSFQVDWKEHWANELEFAFEGTAGRTPVTKAGTDGSLIRAVSYDESHPVASGGCEMQTASESSTGSGGSGMLIVVIALGAAAVCVAGVLLRKRSNAA